MEILEFLGNMGRHNRQEDRLLFIAILIWCMHNSSTHTCKRTYMLKINSKLNSHIYSKLMCFRILWDGSVHEFHDYKYNFNSYISAYKLYKKIP